MLTVSKNKRVQPLYLSDELTGAQDIIFTGSVSTIVDNVLRVTIPGDLRYRIIPDLGG